MTVMSKIHANRSVLQVVLDAEHQRVADLAGQAATAAPTQDEPRRRRRLTDSFSGVLSQHLAAVDDVLLRHAKRRLPAGHEWMHYYVRHTRGLEQALHQLKAQLYGDATSAHMDWDAIWRDMRAMLDDHTQVEQTLVQELLGHMGPDEERQLTERLRKAEETAPTRPHPYTPHTGLLGRIAHRIWRIADNFWDHAEGRLVPSRPTKPPTHPDSLMHRYFTGAPSPDSQD